MQWKEKLSMRQWLMEHDVAADFARSCWQRGDSALPLLLWRALKLLWALGVCGWSLASFWGPRGQWFIYMTHWGIAALASQAALGLAVSVAAHRQRLPDPSFGLPWYIKVYWVLFNISTPVAFLITLFYWTILYSTDMLVDYAPNLFLDISLHGINSVVMLLELLTVAHPTRLLHVYQPVGFGLVYLVFGVIYYFAGGLDPWGNAWVYPVIDWSRPGPTAGVLAATTLVLVVLHLFAVGLTRLRDLAARRLLHKGSLEYSFSNDGFVSA